MCRLMSAAERASTSSRSSEALTSSPISASVARTSAEVSAAAFSASVLVCDSWGFIDSLIIAGEKDRQAARLAHVKEPVTFGTCQRFGAIPQVFAQNRTTQLAFELVPKESTPTSGMLRYLSA